MKLYRVQPEVLCPAHTAVFMCFVWIWEQTAIISVYSINWLVCVTETESVYCVVRTGYLYTTLRSAHTPAFMCFVWIWEQTAIISVYNINWLVCVTETESVYCAVPTGYLYTTLRSAHTPAFMCFVWISEQTAIISLHSINWLVCITQTECLLRGTDWTFNIHQFYVLPTQLYLCVLCGSETECVYCVVRTRSLRITQSSLNACMPLRHHGNKLLASCCLSSSLKYLTLFKTAPLPAR